MLSRLIIIGNGFDLAHGLHTKYSDFMEYLCSYEKEPEIIYGRFVRLDSISPRDQEKHHFYEAISKYILKRLVSSTVKRFIVIPPSRVFLLWLFFSGQLFPFRIEAAPG